MSEEAKPKRNFFDFPIIFAIAVVGILLFVMNLVNETTKTVSPQNDTTVGANDSLQVDSLKTVKTDTLQ